MTTFVGAAKFLAAYHDLASSSSSLLFACWPSQALAISINKAF
jgi:hypothetical protein